MVKKGFKLIKQAFLFTVISLCVLLYSCSSSTHKTAQDETDFCSRIHRNDSISLSDELAGISEQMQSQSGVLVLEDGGKALVTRAWLCEYAEKSIDIQYFIFSTDNVGLIACDYLVRAADRGVKVRIIIDDIMVDAEIKDVLTLASHENISIKVYNPGVNLGKNLFQKLKKFTTDFRSANQRMHNKTFIVDGKIAITGGRNVADEYFDYDHEYNFRDRDVLLLGKIVGDVDTSFNVFWNYDLSISVEDLGDDNADCFHYENQFERLHEYACNPDNFWPQVRHKIENLASSFPDIKRSGELYWLNDVHFVSDWPGKNDGTSGLGGGGVTTDTLISLVRNAKRSIVIQTPYLISTELSQKLFREATQRGVQIRILTNSLASTDNLEAFASYQSNRKQLLNTGVRIFEFKPDAAIRKKIMSGDLQGTIDYTPTFGLHAKSMVIDEETTVVGTFNHDPRSANLNTECIVIINSTEIASEVLRAVEEELKPENSWETTIDFNPDDEVNKSKRIKTWTRKVLPKAIL